jgi:hypothetical protein
MDQLSDSQLASEADGTIDRAALSHLEDIPASTSEHAQAKPSSDAGLLPFE